MHKIYVSESFDMDLANVFKIISNHGCFLSGGGLECQLIREGKRVKNGNGAIRQVVSSKLVFEEEIFDFQENKCFAYRILSITPKQPINHIKGWLEFKSEDGITTVDWHSHFEVTVPFVGWIIGWFVAREMSKVFRKRLKFIKIKQKTLI